MTRSKGMRDLLLRSAEDLLRSLSTKEVLDRSEDGVFAADLWRAIEDNGLHEALAPESTGGAGVGFADAMGILRLAGRYAAPVPLAESMLGSWLVGMAGLPALTGPTTLILEQAADGLESATEAAGIVLTGRAEGVPFARNVSSIVVVTSGKPERILVVPATAVEIVAVTNMAGEPRDRVIFDRLVVPAAASAAVPEGIDGEGIHVRWVLTRVALMAGALEFLLDSSVGYARERQQFGRPIGAFQAIQQQLAVLAGEVAAATAASEAAGLAADHGPARFEAAAAKARVGEAATRAAAIAHQVHGAIGFTWEHDLHTRTRRLWAWRDELGSEGEWAVWLGRHITAQGADAFWRELSR